MTGDKVPNGSIWQGRDGRWYAEIGYMGRRYHHNGSPNESTVQVWLSRKKMQIAADIAKNNETLRDAKEGVADYIRTDINHGPVKASIYQITKKRKSGSTYTRFCVEVQYLGQKIRRTSSERRTCEEFAAKATARINEIIDTANARRDQIRREKDRELGAVGADEFSSIISLFNEMKVEASAGTHPSLFGSTYVIFDPFSGLYKIGKTTLPPRLRLASYCTPDFEIILIAEGDIEKDVHKAFHSKRLRGEWFALDEDDVRQLQIDYGFKKVSIIA